MAIEVAGMLLLVLIFVLFVTQIIFPIASGNRLFPLFRKKLSAIDHEMAQVKEELDLAEAKRRLVELKKSIPEEPKPVVEPVAEKEEKNESETDRS